VKRIVIRALVLLLAGVPCSGQTGPQADQRQAALAFERQGNLAAAEAAWRAFAKAHPANPEPYAHLGLLEARQQHYQQAAPLYRKALALNPNVASVHLDLALALFKDGDMKAAVPEFAAVLKSQPGNLQAITLTGMAYYGLAQYQEAAPYLSEAAKSDTQNLPLRLALAHSCLWSKQYSCVMDTYKEILALNPNSAEADMIAAEAADDMHDNITATRLFRAAESANPKEPNVHFGLGYLLWTLKQYTEAESEFRAELANDPQHTQAMEYLGDTEIQLNRMSDAEPLLNQAKKLDPSLPLVHLDLGIIYMESDRKPEALRELTTAEKLDGSDIDVHWRLGRLYRSMGKKDEAMAEFDKAQELNKEHSDENFRRIANAHAKPAEGSQPAADPAPAAAPPNQPNP
jgi:tetratricopeptide (TPR) repeat protein